MGPMRLPHRFLWLAATILVVGTGLGALLARAYPARLPVNRLSIGLAMVPGGVSRDELKGLRVLLAACVEDDNHIPVTELEKLDEGALPTTRLRLGARRVGERLLLEGSIDHGEGLEEPFRIGPGEVRQVYRGLLERMGLRTAGVDRMLPRRPEATWVVVRALSYVPAQPLPPLQEACQKALQEEPDCALLWGARALVNHVALSNGTAQEASDLKRCDQDFRRALSLAPRTPLLVYLYAFFKSETGDVSEALDLTFEAAPHRPYSLYILAAQAYAARQAGLLEGARRSVARQEQLVGALRWFGNSVENTWLYTGELQRFEDALGTGGPADSEPYLDFYRGYIRLLRGRALEAAPYFERCARHPGAPGDFSRLGNVYHLHLRGETGAALEALRAMDASRLPLATADGELTFKIAEAYALLGAPTEAFESAQRALRQGFACLRWYEESPLMLPLQARPEWKELRAALQEQQTHFQAKYPSERFGG